jgi:hypothetical protein
MGLIGECRNNKECVIDKKNRTSCKACRLQKCLLVGMSKNGSRYGRRSNWFKQFFQETEHQAGRGRTKSEEERSDDKMAERGADATFSSSPGRYFADKNDHQKSLLSADLCSATSLSTSHSYLNYFPRYSLNRFISYDGRETKFWLPNSVPLALLSNEVNANECFERLLAKRRRASQERVPYDGGDNDAGNSEDPLDLSQRRKEAIGQSDTKKSAPLDLSVK